jgi:hypothetical protein
MAKAALFVGWGALIPGREEAAGKVLEGAVAWLTELQRQGRIDSFEPVALGPHGGDLAGFVLVKGDKDAIAELRYSDEFVRISAHIQRVHQASESLTPSPARRWASTSPTGTTRSKAPRSQDLVVGGECVATCPG